VVADLCRSEVGMWVEDDEVGNFELGPTRPWSLGGDVLVWA